MMRTRCLIAVFASCLSLALSAPAGAQGYT